MKLKSSNFYTISHVIDKLLEDAPETVIDVGAGSGKYGMLCREYLPNLKRMDAVEPDEMINGSFYYDNVYQQKIENFKFSMKYDMALLIAVLEYFPLGEGIKVLNKLTKHCGEVLLTIPKESQKHTYQWYAEMITSEFDFCSIQEVRDDTIIII